VKLKPLFASIIVLLFCHGARGQEAKTIDVFAGYSFTRVNTSSVSGLGAFSAQGGELSLSYKATRWFTAVADFGITAAGHHNSNIVGIQTYGTQTTYLFGPRIAPVQWRRITPFAQALFGLAHATRGLYDTSASQKSFAWTAGGGVDYRVNGSLSLRPFQLEFLQSKFSELGNGPQYQNDVRASAGLISSLLERASAFLTTRTFSSQARRIRLGTAKVAHAVFTAFK
jgi:opacity protein-like surface antigen